MAARTTCAVYESAGAGDAGINKCDHVPTNAEKKKKKVNASCVILKCCQFVCLLGKGIHLKGLFVC